MNMWFDDCMKSYFSITIIFYEQNLDVPQNKIKKLQPGIQSYQQQTLINSKK